ncbi:magnesium protoporphyrin IX methyltransferase [Jannaschia pagri]|uniref:Magnesium protoporphyrin IX methyltransferase n=1 Tax=Jannaschia pagri TaxID=2829797 RepID=A0ABQ4NLC1_9RHOB|nr:MULTISPECIES: magnesium protoporphyrin IX methyltransferase [unclassified Jannaschia]GIT91378.1 magnesium protoporphyrin IX methyltransferase [Jannaschia sp. AI_61]GIT95212.1 magnesium protoporphyrin IX methyltransferase [Jannaschia sp. AI_62]
MDYGATRSRVESYFDGTATQVWADLTSDAPVSKVRATVRAGRDRMRDVILSRLPDDLTGARVLDAGCGTGAKAAELARRGADVVAVDISPKLLDIAAKRLPEALRERVTFTAEDMFSPALGSFDAVVAQDSMIYYGASDLARHLDALSSRTPRTVFSVAPRTPLLMAMFWAGKAFPRKDRSPTMVPHSAADLAPRLSGALIEVERVTSGFYISTCLELRA